MSEPIVLTGREVRALADYLDRTCDVSWTARAQGFIDALNELRAPLPIGTVRADEDGNIAVKVSFSASDSWFIHRTRSARCSGHDSDEYVADWPVVHKPE